MGGRLRIVKTSGRSGVKWKCVGMVVPVRLRCEPEVSGRPAAQDPRRPE